MNKRLYLGLGSNLADREHQLQRAVDLLAPAGVTALRVSSIYETKPMYLSGQPMFLNMVVEAQTAMLPRVLVKRLQKIELAMGRRRSVRNGPRIIDIDILFYGGFVIDAPELKVPHPRIEERRFVLEPMAEIAPHFRHPASGRTMSELLAAIQADGIRKTSFRVHVTTAENTSGANG